MITVDPRVMEKFTDLRVILRLIEHLKVEVEEPELDRLRKEVEEEVRSRFKAEELKDLPVFRAYRDFFWKVGVDPTKVRPAAEALIRRTLVGKPVPRINTAVDAYNLASMKTGVALAAFDYAKIKGDLTLRFAKPGEEFLGIGMDRPRKLRGVEVVVADEEKLVAIYPYRDADSSKVTLETSSIALLVCGVPGISLKELEEAERLAVDYIIRFCGGEAGGRFVAPL